MANLNIAIEIAAKDAASGVIGGITRALGGLGGLATGAAMAGVTAIGAGIAGIGTLAMATLPAASDLGESISKVGVVFGDSADEVMAFADTAATALGQSRNQALAAVGTYGNLLTSIGILPDAAADMSTSMVTLASDLASFNNASPEETLLALQSALTGETEPMKRFGVALSAAAIEQQALAMGLADTKGELTPAMKAQAAYALIMEQTTNAQGDFARTSEGLANQQRIAAAQWEDLKTSIGGAFLPVAQLAMGFVTDNILPAFTQWAQVLPQVGEAFGEFVSDMMTGEDPIGNLANLVYSVANAFGADGEGLFNQIIALREPFESFLKTVQDVGASVFESLTSIDFGPLMTAFGDLFATIGADMPSSQSIVTSVADGIKVAAQGLADFMNNILLPAITAVVTWFKDNWPAIKATGEEVMNGLQTAIQTVADAISAFWSEWGDDIQATWDGVVAGVQGVFDTFKLAFEGKWYEFGEKLREGWDGVWESVKGAVQAAIDWFNQQDWGAIGTSIIQGIAGGISSATQFIVDAATSAARAAYDAAKGFLGIQSPSKKFWELGEYSAMGFVGGMDSMQPAMASASADAAYSAYGGAAAVTSSGYGGGIVLNIDARGASDPGGIRAAIEEGVRRGLEAAGVRADRIRRTG